MTTLCKDGTRTTGTGNVACSGHGGVLSSKPDSAPATPAAPAAPKAPTDTTNQDSHDAVAKCKDKSYSHSPRPSLTCVNHGGVAKWMSGKAPIP